MSSTRAVSKNSVEKMRRDALASKIAELKTLLRPPSWDRSRISILELAVRVLTGTILFTPSNMKIIHPMNRRVYKKDHEQGRRNKEAAAYEELKKYIKDKQLPGFGSRLDKVSILTIIVNHLRSIATSTSPSSSSSVPPLVAPILLPLTPPSSSSSSPASTSIP